MELDEYNMMDEDDLDADIAFDVSHIIFDIKLHCIGH